MSVNLVNKNCHCFVVFAVLLFFFYNGVHVQSITDYAEKGCQILPNGVYPVRNLSEYVVCENGTGNISSCRPNEIYSTNHSSCTPLKNITEETFCDNRPTGDWMYIWDCHKYFHCFFNWYKVENCNNNTIYDAIQDVCTTESESTCMVYNLTDSSGQHGTESPLRYNVSTTLSPAITISSGKLNNTNSTSTNMTNDRFTTTMIPVTDYSPSSPITPLPVNTNATGNLINSTSSSNATEGPNSKDLISPSDLQNKLALNETIILIDVRMPWELKLEGKIGVSINIPLPKIQDVFQLDESEFESKYGIKKPKKDDCSLVFHCKTGIRSMKAVDIVKSLGYTCPKSLDGGFEAWKKIYQK